MTKKIFAILTFIFDLHSFLHLCHTSTKTACVPEEEPGVADLVVLY